MSILFVGGAGGWFVGRFAKGAEAGWYPGCRRTALVLVAAGCYRHVYPVARLANAAPSQTKGCQERMLPGLGHRVRLPVRQGTKLAFSHPQFCAAQDLSWSWRNEH